jgi:DNA-binding protein Fis
MKLHVFYRPDNVFTVESEKWPTLRQIESAVIRATLDEVEGNKTHAAKLLDISRMTLRAILKETEE